MAGSPNNLAQRETPPPPKPTPRTPGEKPIPPPGGGGVLPRACWGVGWGGGGVSRCAKLLGLPAIFYFLPQSFFHFVYCLFIAASSWFIYRHLIRCGSCSKVYVTVNELHMYAVVYSKQFPLLDSAENIRGM